MANVKISNLTAATTPVAGTEVLPIVQSGATVKVSIANLTAGRSVSATGLVLAGSTSGTTTLQATAAAGTTTLTLPAATDTLVGKATTDTLTNKTLTGAAMNGTVGATTPASGAFTTLSATSNIQAGTGALVTWGGAYGAGIPTIEGAAAGFLNFYPTGSTNGQIVRISSAGLAATGAMSVGGATPTTSGAGITFPATQSASTDANTLDDYEEGTFTPTATFSSVNTGVTFTNISGIYTKVGNVVTCTINIFFSALGSASGSFVIAGLPFVTQSNGFTARCVGAVFLDRSTNGYAFLNGNGATSLTLQTIPNSTGSSAASFTQANFSNTSYLNITISYQTN
jgi:hypothetical protein